MGTGMMRAVRLHGTGDVRVDTISRPVAPAPGEVILEVLAAGVCGTDLEDWQSGPRGDVQLPLTMGHEICGVVTEIGEDVELEVGDHVVVEVNLPCHSCGWCARGESALCPFLIALGLQADGGMAEAVRVPASACVVIPTTLAPEMAVFAEPLAVAVHAVRRTDPMPEQSAVIIGGGPLGLLVAAVLRVRGLRPLLVEPDPRRLRVAAAFGIDAVEPPASMALRHGTWGHDFAYVATGASEGVLLARRLARRGGTIVLLGVGSEPIPLTSSELLDSAQVIVPVLSHALRDVRDAVELLSFLQVDPTPLLSRRASLNEAPIVFEQLAGNPGHTMKCIFIIDGTER